MTDLKVIDKITQALQAAEMRQGCTNHTHYAWILAKELGLTSDAVCPDDCECLGRMLSVCFARPILSAHGKGFTLNIPVVANLRRCDKESGSVYYRQEHCHYERFKNET